MIILKFCFILHFQNSGDAVVWTTRLIRSYTHVLYYRVQVSQIISACDAPGECHALFSATLGAGVEEFCHAHFNSPVRVIIGQV